MDAVTLGMAKADARRKYAAAGFPAHAPLGLAGRYDPVRCVYNWKDSNTRLLRASIARARAGGYANHLIIGDSRSDNYMGSVDGFDRRKMWPAQYRSQLQLTYPDLPAITDGMIKIGWQGQIDPRVTTSGTWTNNGDILYSSANGASITVATSLPCTNIDLNLNGAANGLTYSIDGGAAQPVTVPAGFQHFSITGLTNTTHTIVITSVTASQVGVHSIVCWSSGGGLVIHNASIYGSRIDPTQPNGWGTTNTGNNLRRWYVERAMVAANLPGFGTPGMPTSGVVPDVVYVMVGVNDAPLPNWIENNIDGLARIRGRFPGSDFVLFADQRPGPSAGDQWPDWIAAEYLLADTLDVPLIDLYARSYPTSQLNQTYGLLSSDALHSPLRWQKEQARVLTGLVAS